MYQISFLLRMNIVLLVVNFHQIEHTKKLTQTKSIKMPIILK